MKRIFATLSAVLALVLSSNAGTINVFAQYLGTTSYSSPATSLQDRYTQLLSQGNLDFGVFYGPSSAADFGFTHLEYTKNSASVASSVGGLHIFIYKTDRWKLLKRYGMSTAGNNAADACVMEDKTTGEQFRFLMPTGDNFPSVNTGSEIAPVTSMRSSCQSAYPNARLIVGVSKTYGIFSGSRKANIITIRMIDFPRFTTTEESPSAISCAYCRTSRIDRKSVV